MNLADTARSLVGVPWIHAGRHPGTGLDCAGLVIVCLLRAGVPVCPNHGDGWQACWCRAYDRLIPVERLRETLARWLVPVPKAERAVGDVLLLRAEGVAQHLAVYVGEERMVHAHEGRERVVEEAYDRAAFHATVGVWRLEARR